MLVEKLSQSDKNMITDWIAAYGISNRDRNSFYEHLMAPLSHILREWSANKQTLWKMFGENFIVEREVSYQRPNDMLYQQMSKALHEEGPMLTFKNKLFNCVERYYSYYSPECYNVRYLFDVCNLKDNRWADRSSTSIKFGDTVFDIPRGAKIMKVLHKMAKHFNLENEFEAFRIQHSQILNQKVIRGTLCLSIHPLDYMTMSDNTYGWDSCMNWEHDGCYRTGTIEMMNSPYMVVAYLRGDKPFRINDELWAGNKKWRELFIVHPHAICNIKAYPYMNKDISTMALEWLRELAICNLGWDIPYGMIEFNNHSSFEYYDEKKYDFYFATNYMYDDFDTDNTCHMIIVPQGWNKNEIHKETILISGRNICVCCGDKWEPYEGHEDQVLCPDCDPGPCCSSCDHQEENEDDLYYVEGNYLCSSCYEDCAGYCSINEEHYYQDNLEKVYLTAVDDDLDKMYLLNSCHVHKKYVEENGLQGSGFFTIDTLRSKCINEETIYYVNMSDCRSWTTEEFFGLWNPWVKENYINRYNQFA